MERATFSGGIRLSSKNRTINKEITNTVMKYKQVTPYSALINRKLLYSVLLIFILALPLLALHFSHYSPIYDAELRGDFISSAETPTLTLTYYSRSNETRYPVQSGIELSGDHVILNATWNPADNVNGTIIVVNATAIPSVISAEGMNNTVEIDTRALGNNAFCTVNVTTWLLNGTVLSESYSNVFIGNFFAPHVQVLTPNGGENWAHQGNITWNAWDENSDDVLTFEVLFSSDGGITFQLLASELDTHWLIWDFSEFLSHNDSVIEVRATDGIYTSSDRSDSPFSAGGISTTATTTGTTPTGTNTLPAPDALDMRLSIFVAAAIIASAFLSLIVYFQAKKLS